MFLLHNIVLDNRHKKQQIHTKGKTTLAEQNRSLWTAALCHNLPFVPTTVNPTDTFSNHDGVSFWHFIFAETVPQAGGALADGGRPAAVFVRADGGGGLRLHGVDGQEEASVGGGVQPQRSGGGWSSAGDGQHAEGSTRGKTHLI